MGVFRLLSILFIVGTLPIITRLYDPGEYSEWIVWTSAVLLVSSIATLSYEFAIILPRQDREAANLLLTNFIVCCVISILAIPGVHLLIAQFPDTDFGQHAELWGWSVPLQIWLVGVFNFCGSWCVRRERFFWFAVGQALMSSLPPALQVGAAVFWMDGYSSLIAGSLIGQGIATLVLIVLILGSDRRLIFESLSLSICWDLSKQYKVYPMYMSFYNLLGTGRDRLIFFVLAKFGTKATVGFYGLAQRIVNIPGSFLGSVARPVFFQHAASEGIESLERAVVTILKILSFSIVPVWVIFLFQAEDIFGFVLGEAWQRAGFYAALLSFSAVPNVLGNWLDRTFDVTGKQKTAFALEFCFSISAIAGVLIGVAMFDDIMRVVVIQVVVMTIYYWYFLYRVFRAAGFSIVAYWQIFGIVFGTFIGWAALAWGLLENLRVWAANGIFFLVAIVACLLYSLDRLQFISSWRSKS